MNVVNRLAAIAIGLICLGFIMIGVAWNGAASRDCIQCQFPYVISGGLGGLGLIVAGASLLLFEAGRRMLTRLEQKLDALQQPALPAAAPATNGGAPKATAANGRVIVGRSSFHRPDCRLVEGKEDMDAASPDEAIALGLQPCRVCDPLSAAAKKK
ncbi:MAG TPA: hypothetical protein VGB83_09985 [Actinomycetota bacterium]